VTRTVSDATLCYTLDSLDINMYNLTGGSVWKLSGQMQGALRWATECSTASVIRELLADNQTLVPGWKMALYTVTGIRCCTANNCTPTGAMNPTNWLMATPIDGIDPLPALFDNNLTCYTSLVMKQGVTQRGVEAYSSTDVVPVGGANQCYTATASLLLTNTTTGETVRVTGSIAGGMVAGFQCSDASVRTLIADGYDKRMLTDMTWQVTNIANTICCWSGDLCNMGDPYPNSSVVVSFKLDASRHSARPFLLGLLGLLALLLLRLV